MAIQVGYGSDRRGGSSKKNLYAGRSSGKRLSNGGFNGCPVVDFTKIDQNKWDEAFPHGYKPSWMREESGDSVSNG